MIAALTGTLGPSARAPEADARGRAAIALEQRTDPS